MTAPDPSRIAVVHLLGSSQPGGIESFVVSLARDIDRSRFALSVVITAGEGPVAAELRALGVDVALLGGAPRSPADWWRLARALYKRRGAIVHANLGGLAMRVVAQLATGGPSIVHVHAPPEELVDPARRDAARERAIVQRLVGDEHCVLTCSEALTNQLDAALPGLRSRVQVVRYGVDLADYTGSSVEGEAAALRSALGIEPNAPVVAFVGRLVPQKGIDHLATIAGAVLEARPLAHVVVAGDGPLRERLRALERGPHAARVHMLGWRRDVPAIVAASDLLVVPSAWEAFGIVCIEAMAAGRPVAAFAVDGIPESVIDGTTGLLVPAGDARALADRVLRLIDDSALRARLGAAGRARVAERFQARFTARHLERIYEELAASWRVAT